MHGLTDGSPYTENFLGILISVRHMRHLFFAGLLISLMASPAWAQSSYKVAYNDSTAYLIPLVKAMYADVGVHPVFQLVPSERAIALTSSGHFDADLSRVEEALRRYPNLVRTNEPIKRTDLYAYARKRSGIQFTQASELKHYSVALIRGAKLAEQFAQREGIDAYPVNSVASFYKMLAAGRFEIALITSTQHQSQVDQIHAIAERIGPVLAQSHSFHVLNKKHVGLIPKLDAALRAMKADGRAVLLLEPN